MEDQIHPNKIRQVLFLIFILLLGYSIVKEMYFMLGAFLGALTIYELTRNFIIKLIKDFKWNKTIAALFIMLCSFLVIVAPFVWLMKTLIDKVSPFIQDTSLINSYFGQIHNYLLQKFDLDIFNQKNVSEITGKLISIVRSALGGTLSTFTNILIMYFILYFMLTQITDIELWVRRNLPFRNSNVNKVIREIKASIYGNALGIPIVAIAQGLVGMIGYFLFGVESFIFMGVLTMITSMIPVVGSMIIYLPLGIYALSQGQTLNGIGILLWGVLAIGSTDNIIRLWLQKKFNDVHPLITIFGVIIGVPMFGFLGVIFGPLLISIFLMLVKVYIDEFGIADADAT